MKFIKQFVFRTKIINDVHIFCFQCSHKKRFDNASSSILFSPCPFSSYSSRLSMRSLPVERHKRTFNTYHTILRIKKQFFLFSFFALCYNSVISLSFTLISFERIFRVYKKICFKKSMYKPQLSSAVRRVSHENCCSFISNKLYL